MIEDTRDEVKWYESAKKGNFMTISHSTGLGRALVALRISRDMTQAELAKKLDVVQSQVSRDEENEYHGVSMDRIYRILAVFEVQLEGRIVKASSPGKEPTHGRQAA
jgi:transcriptional regulator with XRE-family HTH domain